MFEWFLALRYFRSKKAKGSFLNFIKKMAVGGVAVGAAGLLISLSIAHGFKNVIQDKIMGFGPHITIKTFNGDLIQESDTLIHYLNSFEEIEIIQPVVYGQGMIQYGEAVEGVLLKGIDSTDRVTQLPTFVNQGEFKLTPSENGSNPSVVAGAQMAQQLGFKPGSTISFYAIQGIPSLQNLPKIKQFEVNGTFSTDIERLDNAFILSDINAVKELFSFNQNSLSEIEIKLKDKEQIRDFNRMLDQRLPYPLTTESVYQTYGSIFAWIQLQEQTIPFVISIMIIVAAFNLIGTVLMMILERTGDIGILKTMGSDDGRILKIFLLEGFLIAVYGLIIGIGIATAFNWIQSTWQIIPLPAENYYMTYAPVEPHLMDFVIVTGVTIVLCLLSSIIPARIASRMNPLKVIAFGRG
jgi:lipoprotein-releasing system permease protein